MHSFQPDAQGPLKGIRVLDLSRLVAGNMLSLQLADFGAEVIKIEDPKKGDPLRDWRVEGLSVHWKVYARNKKSVTLNLRDAQARDLLMRLVDTAQVFIENYRPGTLEKMGFGPNVLHARNPKLIIVRVTGWGQDGPYKDRPGFGTLVEGVSTFAAKNGFPDRPPVLPPLALADMIAGLYGTSAVLNALRSIEVGGGKGQVIDLPLLDPIYSLLGPEAAIYQLTGEVRPRTGSRSATAGPRNVFETKDGRFIAISASIQGMVERLFRAVGRPDMITDPRFRTNADRVKNAEEAEAPIREFILERTLDDALAVFERAEVTAAPVYDIDQFVADPHVKARGILMDYPDEEMGSVPMHAVVPRLSETPGAIRHAAPSLGEHNAELLGELGLDAVAVEDCRKRGVI
ncbi:bile acid-CoA hydrolase [Variibacter gotjawalensis]|uniref:Bile acid-CoA hydrolase n=1 Tax=Variibacter gotjawalensis TaxID=1333996 RepID=A0A0S3PXE8_9BRAD|nr:CoA transferase [Variibacter gotjawalensis]NIK46420.1 crotonobetainyl-CoA:carnitine CoA-transferase CaiB-like acyl-CoA transferase [Variibacter gotjawalensis]RZS48330.1 crotonobetainyl-CoA:carnitine CoA-transferase CaiB-like acyl-CoA transferase [Variibacter gotjawalensis]BAT60590.1 bile acid-CoA hydrolase [Variibacter gotjawalensis]